MLTTKKVQLPFHFLAIFRIFVFGDFRLACIRNQIQEKCLLVGGDAKAELLDYFMYVVFVEMYGV